MSTGPEGGGGGEESIAVLECLFPLFFQIHAYDIPVHVLMVACPLFLDIFLCKGLGEFQQIQVHVGKVQRQHISISLSLRSLLQSLHTTCSCLSSPRRRCGEVLYTSSSQGRLLSTHSPFPPAYPPPLSLSRDCSRVWRGLFLANVFTYFWNGMTPILERHLNVVTAL